MKTNPASARQRFHTLLFALLMMAAAPVSAQTSATTLEVKTPFARLLSFTGTHNGAKAELKWVTESEVNISHFVIERSTDGVNFTDAGIFFAYGSPSEKTNYSFSVSQASVTAPVVYYRIFVTGQDGKGFYSDNCIVRTGK